MKSTAALGVALAALILTGATLSAPVSTPAFAIDTHPVWSADGTKIAFLRFTNGWSVQAVPATGGEVELLGELPAARPDAHLLPIELSPDWSKVAFPNNAGVQIVDVSGPGSTDVPLGSLDLGWSPDSRFLAISEIFAQIFVVRSDGSDLHKIADGLYPAWSPDGSQLVFALPYYAGLAIASRDGTGYHEIWHGLQGSTSVPAWSPTGDLIAFFSEGSLRVVRTDGTPVRTFTGTFSTNLRPSWSFDGTKIAFSNGPALSVFDLATGSERRFPYAPQAAWAPHSNAFAAPFVNKCSVPGIHVGSATSSALRRLTLDCRIDGTRRRDVLIGTELSDVISGRRGDDRISGLDAPDTLLGGPGDDSITGGPRRSGDDADYIDGGPGDDVLNGGSAPQSEYRGTDDLILGRSGADMLRGGPGRDSLDGGPGNDTIRARDGEPDQVRCGTGRDRAFVDRHDHVARDCETVARR
jgi:RTX calcium-binding nonapeptide repeat (4 copies)/WD40-like Beta Propeller Repeat